MVYNIVLVSAKHQHELKFFFDMAISLLGIYSSVNTYMRYVYKNVHWSVTHEYKKPGIYIMCVCVYIYKEREEKKFFFCWSAHLGSLAHQSAQLCCIHGNGPGCHMHGCHMHRQSSLKRSPRAGCLNCSLFFPPFSINTWYFSEDSCTYSSVQVVRQDKFLEVDLFLETKRWRLWHFNRPGPPAFRAAVFVSTFTHQCRSVLKAHPVSRLLPPFS